MFDSMLDSIFITNAYAQSGSSQGGLFDLFIPLLLIGLVFWFLLIRPQRQAARRREEMLNAIRRNDTIITGGGIIAKVAKVGENDELEVTIAPDVKIKILKSMIADVRVKGEPVSVEKK